MSSSSLTLSPSQNTFIRSPNAGLAEHSPAPQTTPKLPKRERLNSISRLLKNRSFAELPEKSALRNKSRSCERTVLRPPVDIRITPCSPTDRHEAPPDDVMLQKSGKGFLSPNHLPFSPRLLRLQSPTFLSPTYRYPSPMRSPLYSPDRQTVFLGRGSFGKVTLCKYKGLDIAVKFIHNESRTTGEENLLGIRHPHLVQIYHISAVLDGTLVFMEFAGNCNLQQVLETKSELDFRRRLSFCIQSATGLFHCHQNQIVHGDVKPANIMVSPMGICKLGDFGNSARSDVIELSQRSKDVIGTAAYGAPEVLKGLRPVQPSDVYSLGILFWQVQTREMPFKGEHPHVIIYKVVNYGTRPKFREGGDPVLSQFAKVAEDCWRTVPSQRIDASQALEALRDIMQSIKDGN